MNSKFRSQLRRLGAFFLTSALLLGLGTGTVFADVGQPELNVPPIDEIHCASYCVYDKTTGEIILSKEPDKRIYPASQTKIMTCQLALDYLDTDSVLVVSENAMRTVTSDSSVMGISAGEKVQVSELLYGLMLPSGNDAANALAEGVVDAIFEKYPETGTEVGPDGINASFFMSATGKTKEEVLGKSKLDAFVALMNKRAESIGCGGTHFMNPSGLHNDNHYTTAHDLALIISKASENKDFRTLISSETHIYKATNKHRNDAWNYVKNSDNLLFDPWICSKTAEKQDTHLVCLVGGKTGTTSKAGKGMTLYTINQNGHELMISVCGIPADYYYYNTMYVASVVAYGNYTCWQKDPTEVYLGTTGDYRNFNAPEDQQPQYDPFIFPGDELVDYFKEEEVENPEVTPSPTPVPEEKTDNPAIQLAQQYKTATTIIVILVVAIVITNSILLIRIVRLKNSNKRRRRKSSKYVRY